MIRKNRYNIYSGLKFVNLNTPPVKIEVHHKDLNRKTQRDHVMADEKAKVIDKTENKIDSVKSDVPQYKVTADSIKENLMLLPKRTAKAFESLDNVKSAFALPITMSGLSKDDREALNMAFDSAGGFQPYTKV